jgi:hypothetical protein
LATLVIANVGMLTMAVGRDCVKEALLNFALTELSESPINHIYAFIKSEMGSPRHDILTSLLAARDSIENKFEENTALQQKPGANYETLVTCRDSDFRTYFRMNRNTIQV